jgi:hypothetical protein
MSNYNYNPNVDLTDYKPRQMNSQPPNNYMTPEYSFPQEQFVQPPMNNYNQPPMNNYNQPHMNYQQPPMNYYQPPKPYKKRNKVVSNIEKLDLKKPKNNIPMLKKLAIYVILFIIFSHNISITLMCSKLTFLQDNDTLCLLTRSILFAIALYLIQKMNVV